MANKFIFLKTKPYKGSANATAISLSRFLTNNPQPFELKPCEGFKPTTRNLAKDSSQQPETLRRFLTNIQRSKTLRRFGTFARLLTTIILTGPAGFGQTYITDAGTLSITGETYILSNDITTTGTCFTITGNSITLDGAGYTITGSGSDVGVNIPAGTQGITVKNLYVTGFDYGINVSGSYPSTVGNHTLQNNSVSGNNHGISLIYTSNNTLTGDTASNNIYTGIKLTDCEDNTLIGNLANSNNTGFTLSKVGPTGSNNNVLTDNTASSNSNNGISLSQGVNDNVLTSNTTNSNGQYGIKVGGGSNNKLTNNTISYNTSNGIYLDGGTFSDTLTGNIVTYNSGSGIVLWGAGSNNTIQDNTTSHNGYALPEGYIRFGIYILGSNSNTVTGNEISSNTGYGIKISNSSSSNIFKNNTVELNTQYGIHVSSSTGNTIYHNDILNNGTAQASDDDPANNDWHDPGLLEGNYWSDYSGVDDGSGTAKHAIAGDGIGDTGVPHPSADYDSYPFIGISGWEAPAAPQNLTATPGNQQTTLRWDANIESDLALYRIYRNTSSPATTLIDSVTGSPPDTFYTDTGLTNGQTYYYRITAVDSDGNESGYSNEVFATPVVMGNVTDIDGNVYQTVKIGDQWWMAENLKVIHYQNGDGITKLPNNTVWSTYGEGAYCNYDNNDSNADIYGSLYNWYAVNDSRNIAPDGWHVPTDEEWKELEMFLGMSQSEANGTGWRGTDEGSKLKATSGWSGFNGTNESGFSALPGGSRGGIKFFV